MFHCRLRSFCFLIFGVTLILTVAACSRDKKIAGESYTLPGADWPYATGMTFNEKGDTMSSAVYGALLSVRHTHEYPYANLWLELAYSSGDTLTADTFNIFLADSYGKWLGSGSGPVITKSDTLRLHKQPDPGSKFVLRHVMRTEVLPHVEQVGIKLLTEQPEND